MMFFHAEKLAWAAEQGMEVLCTAESEQNIRVTRLRPSNPTGNLFSVAKLFTATAVGICADRGLLRPEDRFLELMGMPLPAGSDARWENVTLHMLLTHRLGLAQGFLDIDVEDAAHYPTDDYLALVLTRPLPLRQGVDFCYSDAAFYLLSRAVEQVTGMTLADFLRPMLMSKMRFGEYAWSCCPYGHTIGATGLYVRCEDMVKLGRLYLQGGVWNGEQLLSKAWCDTVLQRHYELSPLGSGWYGKGGMNGQLLAIHPETDLAVGWTAQSEQIDLAEVLHALWE